MRALSAGQAHPPGLRGLVLGALSNATVQLSVFFDSWQTLCQHDTTFGEFLRQFIRRMLGVTALFLG